MRSALVLLLLGLVGCSYVADPADPSSEPVMVAKVPASRVNGAMTRLGYPPPPVGFYFGVAYLLDEPLWVKTRCIVLVTDSETSIRHELGNCAEHLAGVPVRDPVKKRHEREEVERALDIYQEATGAEIRRECR